MKHLKTYENKIWVKNNSFWLILGDKKYIIKVLNLFSKFIFNPLNNITSALQHNITSNWYDNYIGCFLIFENRTEGFQYLMIENEKELYKYFDTYKEIYTFKGELKIENDELKLDEFLKDTQKYNL